MFFAAFSVILGAWQGTDSSRRPSRPVEVAMSRDTVALTHVNVVPMDRERLLMRRTLIIADGRIIALGSVDSIVVPAGARRIDGGDTVFVLPGLADMHTHVRYESDLALLAANGITTIRNMRGTPWHLALRARVAAGSLLGPRIYTAGPVLYGSPTSGANADAARAMVTEQAKAGFDLIKVYDGLPKASYLAAVAEARRWHMPLAGHIPTAAGLGGVLTAGQASIEHAEQVVYHAFGDQFDDARIPSIARSIAANHTFVTPTLAFITSLELQWDSPDSVWRRPEMQYLDPETYAFWRVDPGHSSAYNHAMGPFLQKLVRGFRNAGVKMLAGTDFYIFGTLPGFGVHRELQALVNAGLTPYEALATATRNPAEFLGETAQWGTVGVGKTADLVLVAGNPLMDIRVTARPLGVVIRGRWLSPEVRQAVLDSVGARFLAERQLVDRLLANGPPLDRAALDSAPVFQASTLNQVGYYLMRQNRKVDAVAVFELVTRRYASSSDAFDSLGDGYLAAGRRDAAAAAWTHALQLDPAQAGTRKKLAALGTP